MGAAKEEMARKRAMAAVNGMKSIGGGRVCVGDALCRAELYREYWGVGQVPLTRGSELSGELG